MYTHRTILNVDCLRWCNASCFTTYTAWIGAVAITAILIATARPTCGRASDQGPQHKLGIVLIDTGAVVTIDDEMFAQYHTRSGTRPVLWPVIGPTGKPVTRSYSVSQPGPDEETDHVHHRSLWFGYEGINGIDFWHEPEMKRDRPLPIGSVRHKEFTRSDSNGKVATLASRNDYLNPSGNIVAHDERLWEFGCEGNFRWIDCRIRLWSSDGPLRIRDTKEGAFAVRVSGTIKVDAKKGGKIVSSNGDENTAAWGKRAGWVDYHGPVDGETVGIAILAHPSSHDPEPRWHVRPYGLLAANPFGAADYTNGEVIGGLEVPEDESVTLRHRVLIHRGDYLSADVAGAYELYKKTK